MKAVKVTDPRWIGIIGPEIKSYVKKINAGNVTYEGMFVYFQRAVQFGGDKTELWVVMDDDKPVAFGHWFVRDVPCNGTVYFDQIYSWTRSIEPVDLLIQAFKRFAVRSNATIYEFDLVNNKVAEAIESRCKKNNIHCQRTSRVNCQGWATDDVKEE